MAHTTPADCRLRRVLVKVAFMPVALAVSASGLLLGAAAIAHNYGYTERWAWAPDVCMLIAGLVYLSFPIQAWRRGWQLMRGGPLVNAVMWFGWSLVMTVSIATLIRLPTS